MTDMQKVPRAIGANYSIWLPESEITLTNVPWDSNYRDIVKFDSAAALNKFIDEQETMNTQIQNAGYARIDEPIRLRIPIDEAYGYNYIRVTNPSMPSVNAAPTTYYYFITGIAMLTPGVTVFNVAIDIWQTFGDKVKLGQSFVEQGHIGIANSNQFQNFGRNYLTVPEGLDTGGEMRVVDWTSQTLVGINDCNIMVVSNTNLTVDPGDEDDPTMKTSPGGRVQGVPSGTTAYFFKNALDFTNFINAYQDYPWVLQGIMQITAIPPIISQGYAMNAVKFPKAPNIAAYTMGTQSYGRTIGKSMMKDWRGTVTNVHTEERYRHLKKFLVYPYLAVELTTMTGTSIIMKPELWRSDDAEVLIYNAVASPGQRSVIAPRHYNGKSTATQEQQQNADKSLVYLHDDGEWIQHATMVGDFPQFAIVNNAGVLALASSAHGRAQQYRAADWSQQKALGSNQTSYDQASAGIQNTETQGGISRWSNTQSTQIANSQAILGAVAGGATGVAMGAATGGAAGAGMGAAGAATGAMNAAIGISGRNQQTALSNTASAASQAGNVGTAAYMRDTSKDLADWAARGNYQQEIAAINAKVQDTAMTPPFTAGQSGGETFNFIFGNIRVYMHVRQINQDQVAMIGDYWLRYGYAIRRFISMDKLQVMNNFTYWKLAETYIESGRVPEWVKQAIRGMFEKGVTVWRDPKQIGNIDWADNEPLDGIFY